MHIKNKYKSGSKTGGEIEEGGFSHLVHQVLHNGPRHRVQLLGHGLNSEKWVGLLPDPWSLIAAADFGLEQPEGIPLPRHKLEDCEGHPSHAPSVRILILKLIEKTTWTLSTSILFGFNTDTPGLEMHGKTLI
jgi:hypothetical protein